MTNLAMKKYGLLAAHDSGIPNGSQDYITLVLIHGFAWHSGVFARLLPLAPKYNARIVLVNRRDYPESEPLGEELNQISTIKSDTPGAIDILKEYAKQRARELYDFLSLFVQSEKVPDKPGIIIAGWSFGGASMTIFLANARNFPVGYVDLARYIRNVVLYDPPYHSLGYPPPAEVYHPLKDPSMPPGEGAKFFSSWVSGYYSHGNSVSELELRKPLANPRPTIETMTPEDIGSAMYPPAAYPGGADFSLMEAGVQHGLFNFLREATLYPPFTGEKPKEWDSIQLKYIWCDKSVWEMPWGTWALQNELEEAKKKGKPIRPVSIAHWDRPEQALKTLLADN
ncbi:uncharacterized protein FOMMEDRAFT_160186 [Fomitiporia mediterranea MF3/22]|uniref:uncharacterized protein n=1 Tax=Fomitiporia mediterranea (strain MF3/22) TaxID=694068 RepID=UPI0004407A7F|nr:uncharacterized protein FOMMEDRAFT_160186 [Fomitiporia mediterranea MF3/22]EJC99741.1 hypothetical protein FOMMEDRAFT_160186 [Fomitiporia mediterranea MF3/22]